jgi:ABC-2 type transport system ATP-binding protein
MSQTSPSAPPATASPPAREAGKDPELPAIELSGIRKGFSARPVLDCLNLRVPQGATYAFLGRNGAGKTTTIRMLMGLLRPDLGSIRVQGMDPQQEALAIRRSVGYLAEDQQMWGWMKISEILRFMAPFYPTWDWPLVQELADKFSLPSNAKIKTLSKGQNVRLGLLLALAHKPQLVILDDPALGLDPIMRKEFLRDVVTHLQGGGWGGGNAAGGGVTVFFSSHLLYEVEPVADIVGILDRGRMVCQEPTELLREQVKQIVLSPTAWRDKARALAAAGEGGGILDLRRDGPRLAITVRHIDAARTLLGNLIEEERSLNLDEIFEAFVAGQKELPNAPHAPIARLETMAR